MIGIVVIRPQPGCDATLAAARAAGLDAQGYPLFRIVPRAWSAPAPNAFDALLIGSANAMRHGGPLLDGYREKPVYAVGAETARVAREAGFDRVVAGVGGLQAVLDRLRPEDRRLLRVAGVERVALTAPAGVTITERSVYASEALAMPEPLTALLRRGALVLLHSAVAAQHLAGQCDALALDRSAIALAALGPRIAEAAESGWRAVGIADRPDDATLLALAAEMCQTRDGSGQNMLGT